MRRNVARELARLDLVGEISILDKGVLQQVSTSSDVLAAPSSTGQNLENRGQIVLSEAAE